MNVSKIDVLFFSALFLCFCETTRFFVFCATPFLRWKGSKTVTLESKHSRTCPSHIFPKTELNALVRYFKISVLFKLSFGTYSAFLGCIGRDLKERESQKREKEQKRQIKRTFEVGKIRQRQTQAVEKVVASLKA